MFGRIFGLTSLLIFLGCLLMGTSLRFEMGNYLLDRQEEDLRRTALSMAALATAYADEGNLEENWDFRMSLTATANAADSRIMVADETGTIYLTSCNHHDCVFLDQTISVLPDGDGYFECGTLNGLFDEDHYAAVVPIVSEDEMQGYVLTASALTSVGSILKHSTNVAIITGFVILLVSLVAATYYSRKEMKPLKELTTAAREFGHGNLKARVHTGGGSSEEMEQLAIAFNNMATSLEQSETQRREFVANVSHELKTPMTTISGFLDGMLDGTIPPERHRDYMLRVSDEVRRLSRLVRSMLEIARIQDHGIPDEKRRKFDICETIGRALLTFEQKIIQKGLQVEVQMPDNGLGVWADEDAITQVVYNLIDNAVKFCDDGGCLFLQVESNGVKATVSVANTGDTIPPEELPLVFDRFHKTDKSRSLDKNGVGLGLHIVKTIVVGHGEDIAVTSRDRVTRFSFTLPVK